MACILQRLGGLPADRLGRCQPQDERPILLHPGIARDRGSVGAEQRLAAAGRQAQADIGRVRQSVQGLVGPGVAAEPPSLFRLRRYRLVGRLRPGDACLLEETAQDSEGVLLVGLQVHRRHRRAFTS